MQQEGTVLALGAVCIISLVHCWALLYASPTWFAVTLRGLAPPLHPNVMTTLFRLEWHSQSAEHTMHANLGQKEKFHISTGSYWIEGQIMQVT